MEQFEEARAEVLIVHESVLDEDTDELLVEEAVALEDRFIQIHAHEHVVQQVNEFIQVVLSVHSLVSY